MTKVILRVLKVPSVYQTASDKAVKFRYEMGRDMARKTVATLYNICAEKIHLAKTDDGCPYAIHEPENKITPVSISHTLGYVAVVATLNATIKLGVDVENENRFENANQGLIDTILSPTEQKNLGLIKQYKLAKAWVSKEAYVKAIGTGFKDKPARYILPHNHNGCVSQLEDGQFWRCDIFSMQRGYLVSVGMLSQAYEEIKSINLQLCDFPHDLI